MSNSNLDRLAQLARIMEQARLAQFRAVQARARAIEDKIKALKNTPSDLLDELDIHALAQFGKWQQWQMSGIRRLQTELSAIAPELEQARQGARTALGRVEIINQITRREDKKEKQQRERRAAF